MSRETYRLAELTEEERERIPPPNAPLDIDASNATFEELKDQLLVTGSFRVSYFNDFIDMHNVRVWRRHASFAANQPLPMCLGCGRSLDAKDPRRKPLTSALGTTR